MHLKLPGEQKYQETYLQISVIRKEYGPHIFARVNYAYHDFFGWVRTRVFLGFGAIDVYGPET